MRITEQQAFEYSVDFVKNALSNPAYVGLYLDGKSACDIAEFIRTLTDQLSDSNE